MSRQYEIVYIFDSALEETQVNEHLERFHALLKAPEFPTPVTSVSHWGKRQLAYAIKGKELGHYAVAQFETDPKLLQEFERAIKLEDTVLTGEQQASVAVNIVYPGPHNNSDGHSSSGDSDPYAGLLDQQLLFSEIYQGYVRAARVSRDGTLAPSQHLFHLDAVISMDVGPDGFIYGVTHFDSKIFRIVLRTDN